MRKMLIDAGHIQWSKGVLLDHTDHLDTTDTNGEVWTGVTGHSESALPTLLSASNLFNEQKPTGFQNGGPRGGCVRMRGRGRGSVS